MKPGATIVVTGAGGGLGRALCRAAASAGFDVVAAARCALPLDDLGECRVMELDVTDEADLGALAAMADQVDSLVHCAAIPVAGAVEDVDPTALRAAWEVNVLGALRATQAVLPAFRARGAGLLVAVSSTAGRLAGPFEGGYSATKWALEALFETLHLETIGTGVRVLIAEPGSFQSDFDAKAGPDGSEDAYYTDLRQQWCAAAARLRPEGKPTADAVAIELLAAMVATDGPLRVPIGSDASLLLPARQSSDDESFYRYVESLTGFPLGRQRP